MEYFKGGLTYCSKCEEKGIEGYGNSETWIDGKCIICNPKPPSTDVILALSFKKMKSINGHLTFYSILVIINLVGLLLLLFGVIEL